jgi:hypothetical protein
MSPSEKREEKKELSAQHRLSKKGERRKERDEDGRQKTHLELEKRKGKGKRNSRLKK